MDSIKFKFDWGFFRDFLRNNKAQQTLQQREVTKCDCYVQLVYKILSWDDPTMTLTAFLALNFFFWIVVSLQLKVLGVIFIVLLVAIVADWYFEEKQILPQNTYLEAVDQLKNDLTYLIFSLKGLRKESPSSFCFVTSGFFLFVSILARNISGYVLTYLSLLALFFLPLAVKIMPEEYVKSFRGFFTGRSIDENDLMPPEADFVSDFAERDVEMESILTDKTSDSVTASLMSGLSSMPSHMEQDADEDQMLNEDDLLPNDLSDRSSDSDSFHKGIRFESGHFNGDSSSEDERNFQKDLASQSTGQKLLKMATDNVLKMVTRGGTSSTRKDSNSSDSEFEIINTDEANNC